MNEIPVGFQFSGVASGVKPSGKTDLSLIYSEYPATAAGLYTTNRLCAAPVKLCRSRTHSDTIRGVVINSGNANACTGEQGDRDALKMTDLYSEKIGCDRDSVLLCSTGIIGRPLNMEKIETGLANAFDLLGTEEKDVELATLGILTTDTRPKSQIITVNTKNGTVTLFAFCKGSAMIGPNMATMLAFILTDAKIAADELDRCLRLAVDKSFHCISVEGHTSTNDTVIALANGASGVTVENDDLESFRQAFTKICQACAMDMIADAEGITHRMIIDVKGCRTEDNARTIAKTVSDSALVKTAVHGNDPNWGRICSAAGYSGVDFKEADLSLTVNGTLLYDCGTPTEFDERTESAKMKSQFDTHIELTLNRGDGECRFWASDLSKEYVRLNADYTT